MERKIIETKDGSHTICVPAINVTYHSIYGAISESKHVFIEAGLKYYLDHFDNQAISILEVGFGTGLNALLTAIEIERTVTKVYYVALEPFPITPHEANYLNYCKQLAREDLQQDFASMHECEWNKTIVATEKMLMHKANYTLQQFEHKTKFDVIYFDAFAPSAQAELWTKQIFEKMYDLLKPGGILVTYCSKGEVRRAMLAAGLDVQKLPGPPGKREMIRAARKTSSPAG